MFMLNLNTKVQSWQEGIGGADNKGKDESVLPKCG